MDDWQLLNDYATRNSEEAFRALVERYAGMVFHTALRQLGNPHSAEEVAQAVFIILAQKAATIHRQPTLYGWLFRATRFAVLNQQRQERNRVRREQKAYVMQSASNSDDPNPVWEQITPHLDDALEKLPATDRELVMIRYFGNKSHREAARMLGVSEEVVRKRLSRAMEKLRVIFVRRGVAVSSLVLVAAFTAHGVQAAPLGLASSLTGVAVAKGAAVSSSTLTLIKGALKIMAWTKTQTTVVVGLGVLLLAGTATVGIKKHDAYYSWRHPDPDWNVIAQSEPQVTIVPTKYRHPVYGLAMAGDGRWIGIRATVTDLVRTAYRWPAGRIYFPAGEPTNRYDFASTLSHGTETALQKKIETKLGLVGRHETREADVFLLKVRRPGALRPHSPKSDVWDRRDAVNGRILCMGEPLSSTPPAWPFGLTKYLELFLKAPVIDETGLAAKYDIDLNWKEDPQDPDHVAMKSALVDQLGLELVPAKRPVELLVVEKVK